jgi:hypothetical protein
MSHKDFASVVSILDSEILLPTIILGLMPRRFGKLFRTA